MNGFTNIVNGFSQVAIDALKTQADSLYLSGSTGEETGDSYAQVNASTWTEVTTAMSNATEDTKINLTGGVNAYNSSVTLTGNGTNKIVIEGGTTQQVLTSTITMSGDNITLRKLKFQNQSQSTGAMILITGSDCKLLRNDFDDCQIEDWVEIESTAYRIEISNNYFRNRTWIHATSYSEVIVTHHDDNTATPYAHYIHHNYFDNIRDISGATYAEVILLYTTDGINPPQSIDNQIVIEYNYLNNTEGDGRIVDSKTNGVKLRYNTAVGDVAGKLKNRSGNLHEFHRNVFDCAGGGENDFGGLSAQGQDNTFYQNYVVGYAGATNSSSYRFYYGGTGTGAQYNQMINLSIDGDILVNAYEGIEFGRTNDGTAHGGTDLPITDVTISNLQIINGGASSTSRGTTDMVNDTWTNCVYSGSGGTYQSEMTLDNGLVATPPAWKLTGTETGPDAVWNWRYTDDV